MTTKYRIVSTVSVDGTFDSMTEAILWGMRWLDLICTQWEVVPVKTH